MVVTEYFGSGHLNLGMKNKQKREVGEVTITERVSNEEEGSSFEKNEIQHRVGVISEVQNKMDNFLHLKNNHIELCRLLPQILKKHVKF